MAELLFSAFLRKKGGVSFRKTQPISRATIGKLSPLKISLARSLAVPLSSAACALTAAKNKKVEATQRNLNPRPRFIAPLSQDHPASAELAIPGAQSPRLPALPKPQHPAPPRPPPWPPPLSPP